MWVVAKAAMTADSSVVLSVAVMAARTADCLAENWAERMVDVSARSMADWKAGWRVVEKADHWAAQTAGEKVGH